MKNLIIFKVILSYILSLWQILSHRPRDVLTRHDEHLTHLLFDERALHLVADRWVPRGAGDGARL